MTKHLKFPEFKKRILSSIVDTDRFIDSHEKKYSKKFQSHDLLTQYKKHANKLYAMIAVERSKQDAYLTETILNNESSYGFRFYEDAKVGDVLNNDGAMAPTSKVIDIVRYNEININYLAN